MNEYDSNFEFPVIDDGTEYDSASLFWVQKHDPPHRLSPSGFHRRQIRRRRVLQPTRWRGLNVLLFDPLLRLRIFDWR